MYKLYEATILRQWIRQIDTTRFEKGKYIVVRSTFTLDFYLKAFSKIGHKEVKPKERVTASVSAGNKEWSLRLSGSGNLKGRTPEMRKLNKGALEIC